MISRVHHSPTTSSARAAGQAIADRLVLRMRRG
jgi:hypothetical protein